MKYIFTVEWTPDFVAAFKEEADVSLGKFAAAYVKEQFNNKLLLAVCEDGYCQWVAPNLSEVEARPIYETITNYFVLKLNLMGKRKVMTVRYYPYGASVKGQEEAPTPIEEEASVAAEEGKNELTEDIEDLCDDLIGAADFKALIGEIAKLAPFTANGMLGEVLGSRHYLFSIDKGYDVEQYVDILREALRKAGMFGGEETDVEYETIKKEEEKLQDSAFDDALGTVNSNVDHSVLVADVSAWMDSARTELFRGFLQQIAHQSNNVVIFVVPFVEQDALQRVRDAISDVLNLRTVTFVPFSSDELRLAAERYLGTYGATMRDEEAWAVFHSLVLREKSDGNFYGVSTVKKICRDMLIAKALYNADNGVEGMCIAAEELAAIAPHEEYAKSAAAMLDGMIGLASVRAKLNEIVEQIAASRKLADFEMPSVHMRFVGNPGTGKTTVARIMGRMLKERGLLRIGDLHEIHGRDLVGRYVGETAPKTASICRDAYGSVLFIDEAYSLCRELGNTRDFGREALDTLIAQMENHRTDMVVIMAGYTDDIDNMMKANAGLENRMPYLVEFSNYKQEELYEIFAQMLRRFGRFDEDVLPEAKRFFLGLADSYINDKTFGNGRYVRNLYERTRAKAIMRCQIEQAPEICIKKQDFVAATADREFRTEVKDRRSIGFN